MKKGSIVAERLKSLREKVHLSQAKLAAEFEGIDQTAIFRYEKGQSFPPYNVLMQYADYFDVSLDYIFGRTDNPYGKYFGKENLPKDAKIDDFIEMCFDPTSPANAKLKQALLKLMEESE